MTNNHRSHTSSVTGHQSKKRILILSGGGADQMNTSIRDGFVALGHEARIYFGDQPSRYYLPMMKLSHRVGFDSAAIMYWQKFKEANDASYEKEIMAFGPDVIFMIGFNSITSRLVRKLTKTDHIPTAYVVIADPFAVDPVNSYYVDCFVDCSHLFFMCPESIPAIRLISSARMTPFAFPGDPAFYKPLGVRKEFDIFMLGQFSSLSASTTTKAYILNALCAEGFSVAAAGAGLTRLTLRKEFPHLKKLNILKDVVVSIEEANEFYNKAKIVLATGHPRDKGGLHPRVVEGALAGSFVLADAPASVREYFGEAITTFDSIRDLSAKISYYLTHEAERERQAAEAHAIALRRYTYRSCAHEMLSFISPSLSAHHTLHP